MKNPGQAASGSGFGGEPGNRCLPAAGRGTTGRRAGDFLQLSPAPGRKTPASGGPSVFPGGNLGLDLSQLRRLPGRYPDGVPSGYAGWPAALGKHCRPVAEAVFFRVLEVSRGSLARISVPLENNFRFYKKIVCICGKMGYNREYKNLRSKAEKGYPWPRKTPRPKT